jgi:hypothetical protein
MFTQLIVRLLTKNGANIDIQDAQGSTPLHLALIHAFPDIVYDLLYKDANVNLQDIGGSTPLHIAVMTGDIELVDIIAASGADIGIKDALGFTPLERAEARGYTQIAVLLRDISTGMWKGFPKITVTIMDEIFGQKPNDVSLCPICLKSVQRADGCMYMEHDCNERGGFYDRVLYDKYKDRRGIIEWCTVCNRITKTHRHYKLARSNDPVPELEVASAVRTQAEYFKRDCRPYGGGGLEEKLLRFTELRQSILNASTQVGTTSNYLVYRELVRDCWNAPFDVVGETSLAKPPGWNAMTAAIPDQINNAAPALGPAPNIPFAGIPSQPVSDGDSFDGMDTFTATEPGIGIHHRQKNGTVKDHSISKESLEGFIAGQLPTFGLASFGYCFLSSDPGPAHCDAKLHPEEVRGFIDSSIYNEYKSKFNEKFRGQGGGSSGSSGGSDGIFEDADALCSVKRPKAGGYSRRKHRVKRTYKHRR